jgi:N-acetylmuramoyl-L-alanine amidase
MCLEGTRVVEDCLYFFAPALSAGTWIVKNGIYHTTIGCHRFYR